MDVNTIDFKKSGGLVPAIIRDADTKAVLMLGYMNKESLEVTLNTGFVTFYSRSKNRLWKKGEESGNVLHLKGIKSDCDHDTLLIDVKPQGSVCHTGSDSCWNEENKAAEWQFLTQLQNIINDRAVNKNEKSYTSSLMTAGVNKIAQKVGEEAVEVIIEAMADNHDRLLEESADLLYHLLVLLNYKNLTLKDVVQILQSRHR